MYLFAYDISDPKRLARVARILEKEARRVQYSVFLFKGNLKECRQLFTTAVARIDPVADRLQVWRLADAAAVTEWEAGDTIPQSLDAVVACPLGLLMIESQS